MTMTAARSFRRGFTLIELVISIVVLGVVGAGLLQMIMSQGRFMEHQEAWRSSRAVSRSTLNRLFAEARNVEAVGGVEAAAAGGTDFTLRVPYAYGIMCASTGVTTTLSLLPVDSAMYDAPGFSGFSAAALARAALASSDWREYSRMRATCRSERSPWPKMRRSARATSER